MWKRSTTDRGILLFAYILSTALLVMSTAGYGQIADAFASGTPVFEHLTQRVSDRLGLTPQVRIAPPCDYRPEVLF